METSDIWGNFMYIFTRIGMFFVVFGAVKFLFDTPKNFAKKKVEEMGGELLEVMTNRPFLDRTRPYLEEALAIEEKLIEEGKAEMKKRDRIRTADRVRYRLNGKERIAYIIAYQDNSYTAGQESMHHDWIEEEVQ